MTENRHFGKNQAKTLYPNNTIKHFEKSLITLFLDILLESITHQISLFFSPKIAIYFPENIAQKISPLLSELANDISLNDDLFKRIKYIYDKRNKNIGLIGIFIDITEEKNAVFIKDLLEQAISSSENLAIIYEKRTSKKLYISGNIKEILGFTKEEYVQTGKDIWLEKLCKEPQLSDISANSNYKSTTVYEQMHVCKDKTVKWLEANCSQINYCGKECILVILRDITSRHENDRLKKLLKINIDNMAEAISIVTLKDNRNLYLNDACCTLTGYSKEVFLNKNGYEFWLNNILHPDFKKQYIDNRNIKKSIKQEYKIIRAGGEEKWVKNSMSTIFFENEESHLSVEIDISNQK